MKIACLFRGNLRQNDRTKDKFNEVIKSIYKLFDSKDIDFFMHLWGDESEYETYKDHFKKDNLLVSANQSIHEYTLGKIKELNGFND